MNDPVTRLYNEVLGQRQFQLLPDLVSADYRSHAPAFRGVPALPPGLDALARRLRLLAEIPHRVVRLVADGDSVFAHVKYEEATPMAAVDVFRLGAAGRIAEHWNVRQPLPGEGARGDDRFATDLRLDPALRSTPEELKALLRELLLEFWGQGQAQLVSKYYAESYIQHNVEMPGGFNRIKEIAANDIRRYIELTGGPFPIDIHRMAAADDLVCVHLSIFMAGIGRDDGRRSTNVDIFRVGADRRMVEHWDVLQIDGAQLPSTASFF
jgi:predicted SnoaL-like aldol condensation-catalyzing enzyme